MTPNQHKMVLDLATRLYIPLAEGTLPLALTRGQCAALIVALRARYADRLAGDAAWFDTQVAHTCVEVPPPEVEAASPAPVGMETEAGGGSDGWDGASVTSDESSDDEQDWDYVPPRGFRAYSGWYEQNRFKIGREEIEALMREVESPF